MWRRAYRWYDRSLVREDAGPTIVVFLTFATLGFLFGMYVAG